VACVVFLDHAASAQEDGEDESAGYEENLVHGLPEERDEKATLGKWVAWVDFPCEWDHSNCDISCKPFCLMTKRMKNVRKEEVIFQKA
jgi:hypothetical protein